jgi:hypothetical protein
MGIKIETRAGRRPAANDWDPVTSELRRLGYVQHGPFWRKPGQGPVDNGAPRCVCGCGNRMKIESVRHPRGICHLCRQLVAHLHHLPPIVPPGS